MEPVSVDWTVTTVAGDGVDIAVHRAGAGSRCVVLLHGFSDDARCWTRLASGLLDSASVVAIDARNHGRSGTGPGGPDVHAGDVIAALDASQITAAIVVGHSVGARTAADLAVRRPDLVDRLILLDPPWRDVDDLVAAQAASLDREAGIGAHISAMSEQTEDELWALVRAQHGDWDEADQAPWVAAKHRLRPEAAADLRPTDWRTQIASLDRPTMLVLGDPDRGAMLSADVAAEFVAGGEGREAVQIPDAGHNLHREQFDLVAGAIRAASGV